MMEVSENHRKKKEEIITSTYELTGYTMNLQCLSIERILGVGGMATVYLAPDLRHQRHVALKVLHPELGSSLGAVWFLREIAIAAGLTHPHILPVHDSGSADGVLYYVMPYVDGPSLRQRLERDAELPVADAVRSIPRAGFASPCVRCLAAAAKPLLARLAVCR